MAGGWLGRQRRSLWWSLPLAWGLAGLAMVSFLGLGFAALEKITAHPPGQSSWNWSYGQSMGIFFGSVPLAAVAWALAQAILVPPAGLGLSSERGRYRRRRRAGNPAADRFC